MNSISSILEKQSTIGTKLYMLRSGLADDMKYRLWISGRRALEVNRIENKRIGEFTRYEVVETRKFNDKPIYSTDSKEVLLIKLNLMGVSIDFSTLKRYWNDCGDDPEYGRVCVIDLKNIC